MCVELLSGIIYLLNTQFWTQFQNGFSFPVHPCFSKVCFPSFRSPTAILTVLQPPYLVSILLQGKIQCQVEIHPAFLCLFVCFFFAK